MLTLERCERIHKSMLPGLGNFYSTGSFLLLGSGTVPASVLILEDALNSQGPRALMMGGLFSLRLFGEGNMNTLQKLLLSPSFETSVRRELLP